jgi:thiosulfate dehydrogenase [quinone] large subunit
VATSSSGPIQIIKLADLAVGQTHQFALSNGMPAIVFRTKNGVFAYSATCTHEGCTVSYRDSNKSLYCPCHGAEFDPFNNGGVISGPTQDALPPVKVKIDGDWVVQA